MPETKPEIARESSGATLSAKIIAIAVLSRRQTQPLAIG